MRDLDVKNIKRMLASLDREHTDMLVLLSDLKTVHKDSMVEVSNTFNVVQDVARIISQVELPTLVSIMSRERVKIFEVKRMLSATRPKSFEVYAKRLRNGIQMSRTTPLQFFNLIDKMIEIKYVMFEILLIQYVGMKCFKENGCYNVKDREFLREIEAQLSDHRTGSHFNIIRYFSL